METTQHGSSTETMPPSSADTSHNPFQEEISPAPTPMANPFTSSPFNSRPTSSFGSSSAIPNSATPRYFHSRRVRKGEIEQPWKAKKDPKEKWVTIIPIIGLLAGLAIAGFLVYDGISSVVHHTYCPVLNEDFSQGLNPKIWTKEAEVGGFGYALFFLLLPTSHHANG